MKIRVHVWVSGHVQGVSFRYYTKEQAEDLDVNGWIKNLPDGKVEAVFEGEESAVNQMIEFCRHGSTGAHVNDVQAQKEKFINEFQGFGIVF